MKNIFASLLIGLSLLTAPASAANLKKLNDQAIKPVVQLNMNCSGVVIRSEQDHEVKNWGTYILTAKHCIKENLKQHQMVDFNQYDEDGLTLSKIVYRGEIFSSDWKSDLALIKIMDKRFEAPYIAEVAQADVRIPIGSDVVTVGHPLGAGITVTEGMFGAREWVKYPSPSQETEYFRATPNISPGNLGGGLFLEEPTGDYKLIGIVSAGANGHPHVGLYVTIDQIREYIDRVFEPKKVTPATH